MRMKIAPFLLIAIIFTASGGTIELPPPPPASDFGIAAIAAVYHTRIVITTNTTATPQIAPGSPLLLYTSRNLSIVLDDIPIAVNGTNGTRITLIEELDYGYHTISVPSLNLTITIYVLTPTEEAARMVEEAKNYGDPRRLKRLYAILATIAAISLGVPAGRALRELRESKRGRKVEEV